MTLKSKNCLSFVLYLFIYFLFCKTVKLKTFNLWFINFSFLYIFMQMHDFKTVVFRHDDTDTYWFMIMAWVWFMWFDSSQFARSLLFINDDDDQSLNHWIIVIVLNFLGLAFSHVAHVFSNHAVEPGQFLVSNHRASAGPVPVQPQNRAISRDRERFSKEKSASGFESNAWNSILF